MIYKKQIFKKKNTEPVKEESAEEKLIRLVEERVRYSVDTMIRAAIDKEMEKIEESTPRPRPTTPEEYQKQILDNLLDGAVPETKEEEEMSTQKFVKANPKLFDHP